MQTKPVLLEAAIHLAASFCVMVGAVFIGFDYISDDQIVFCMSPFCPSKTIAILGCLVFTLLSCTKRDQCFSSFEPTAPEGYEIQKLNSFEGIGWLRIVYFVSNAVGFIVIHKDTATELLKTTDGGRSWESLGEILASDNAYDIFFWDEQTGIIPMYSGSSHSKVMKTEDGGQNWQEVVFPELTGSISGLFTDEMGVNVYGTISSSDRPSRIIKSTDNGVIWETIFELPSWYGRILDVKNGRIYVRGLGDELLVLDLEGNEVGHFQVKHLTNVIVDFQVIDDENIVAVDYDNAVKSSDGGQNWELFFDGDMKLIDFMTPDEGLMMLYKGYCKDDALPSYTIAYTMDGGQSWAESGLVLDMEPSAVNVAKVSTSHYVLLVTKGPYRYDMYELKAD